MHTLYLASGSPRRREILENLGYNVIRLSADIDETPQHLESAAAYVARMAAEKNTAALLQWQAQHHHAPEYPILSADTTVALHNRILGKPESAEHAREMLQNLSGSVHQVLTAVSVHWQGHTYHHTQQSDVAFKTLSEAEISAYIAGGEPMDKAGAYGVQSRGALFVERIDGDFFNVMGLPVEQLGLVLARFGVKLL